MLHAEMTLAQIRDNPVLRAELLRKIENQDFEFSESGVLFPRTGIQVGGVFGVRHHRWVIKPGEIGGDTPLSQGVREVTPWEYSHNLIFNIGLNHVLTVLFKNTGQVATWYIGCFEGDYTPAAGETFSSFLTNATEWTGYDETDRQEYAEGSVSSQSIDNTASRAVFTSNETKTVFGAFVTSNQNKSASTGELLAGSRFPSSKQVDSGDKLEIDYTFSASSA